MSSELFIAAFWALLAAFVAFYGNGEFDLVTLVIHDGRLNRVAIQLALINTGINLLLFCYIYLWEEGLRGRQNALNDVKWAVPVGGLTFAVAVISFMVGLWPLFSLLSPLIVVVETYGLIMALNFAPTFGFLRMKRRTAVRGWGVRAKQPVKLD
mmetsp:Transcript_30593/g.67748  ORF Transcript_30593/g.67748 Transcript_30593/m.67748 type:complete len:154 (+) Transcript_30593:51-512(+)|eukprot:CAMPEP_0202894066 /NCGR_PEP_ID=MMETSP1392-20130828/3521_1 /ASSEMBLY_ACC=CAM_ASM_000868 /TAXON_ID=225041 /ORGANISM="Chlamydomonas chlamydogama, Strain SAG 11-48b" /LENGTH=153 /DNA_ID=CAMNT_0049578617 /DNA_START=86 /DNA_END=547 /DNA_ORIENTATION=-